MYSHSSIQQIISDRIDYLSKRRKNVISSFPQLRRVYDNHYLNMLVILSRDKNVTKEQIETIRLCLKEYFREKQHTKPDYRLLPSLFKLMIFNIRPKERNYSQTIIDKKDSFFE